ncbi:MAG: hypothetical protein K6F87_03150 [Lachnospiraceae bacterium]|nr:hypothetical protein [Lachnospiraceae bacterium]
MDIPAGKSAYLICGDDEFRVSLATKELLDRLVPEADREFSLDQVDGRVGTVDETVAILRSVRDALVSDSLFGSGSKTVWLREPAFLSNDRIGKSQDIKGDLADLIFRIKEGLGEGMCLVVSTLKINRASAFFKAFAGKDCFVADFGSGLKGRQRAAAAADLVTDFCKRLKLKMEPEARALFLSRVGTESRQIVSELEKLACYCGEGQAATADDVRAIVSSGAVSEVWDFTDAFCTRDPKALVAQVRMQLGQGENAIRLVNSLLTNVGDLLAIREGFERHWASPAGAALRWDALPADIAEGLESADKSILGAGGFTLRKKIDQANLWTVRDLRNARHYLLELRELLVSCGLPEDILLETKLLQAIGLRRRAAPPKADRR